MRQTSTSTSLSNPPAWANMLTELGRNLCETQYMHCGANGGERESNMLAFFPIQDYLPVISWAIVARLVSMCGYFSMLFAKYSVFHS